MFTLSVAVAMLASQPPLLVHRSRAVHHAMLGE
jgi:hypothetical protein